MFTHAEKEDVKVRCERTAVYIIEESATVRLAASQFGISKSTVHKDVTCRLRKFNPILHRKVKEVLEENKRQRHIRGGEATKRKYMKQ